MVGTRHARTATRLGALLTLTALVVVLGGMTARPAAAQDGDGATGPKVKVRVKTGGDRAGRKAVRDGKSAAGRVDPEALFRKLDTNSDGKLTLEEIKARAGARIEPERIEKVFKKVDANSDAGVTLEELKAAREAFRERIGRLGQRVRKARKGD
jgi:hypothetical protein